MMDYTQLTDDELRRKVLELMGWESLSLIGKYEVLHQTFGYGVNEIWIDPKGKYRKNAPDPLTDANVYMALVDEIGDVISMIRIGGTWRVEYDYIQLNRAYSSSIGRAICEMYCQVKEQK